MLQRIARRLITFAFLGAALLTLPGHSFAQSPQVLDEDATRYMALGDSIAAGYKLAPITDGYAYLLYQDGVFDRMPHTLYNNVAAVGATSGDVLARQVPEAIIPFAIGGFHAKYITLTVGGNDILAVVRYAALHPNDPGVALVAQAAITQYVQNLSGTIGQLLAGLPGVKIFVANQYTIPDLDAIVPGTSQLILGFNAATQQVVSNSGSSVRLVDVYSAFLGRRNLLWSQRSGSAVEVHPTGVGHRVMEKAFEDVIDANK